MLQSPTVHCGSPIAALPDHRSLEAIRLNLFSRSKLHTEISTRDAVLTLPALKTEYAAEKLYLVPRVRTAADGTVTHLDNALRRYPRVLLVGAAGSGKSSALKFASAITNAPVHSFADFHPQALPDQFQDSGWILLDDTSQPAHTTHLETLAAKFPTAKIWAAAKDARHAPAGFTVLALEPLNEREIVSFAEAWFPMTGKHNAQRSKMHRTRNRAAQDFVASVQANAGTRELAITPLYLFLLLQVYQPAARTPAQPASAEKIVLPMIGQAGTTPPIDAGARARVTPSNAATPFDVPQRANVSALPSRRAQLFDAYVNAKFARESDPDFAARAVEGVALSTKRGQRASDEHLARGCDFLVKRPGGRVEFKHALLHDFFAARALRRNPDFAPLCEHLFDPEWRDVVLFYAGLGDGTEVVKGILESDREVSPEQLYFAAKVLAATDEPLPDLLEQVVKALVAGAWQARDERAGDALGRLHSNPASDFFAAKLRDKDPAVRRAAARILGRLHTDRALEYLLPQLRDPDADVRDQVIASLGASRSERVIEPLLVGLRGDPRLAVSDTRAKIASARALGEYGTDKAVPALIVDLQVGDPDVRAEAVLALEKIRSEFAVKPLTQIAATDKRPEVRDAAAQVLNDMRGE